MTVQAEILDLLRRCRDEFGTAIVLITYNMGVIADLADRVAVMYQGNVVEQADVKTLFAAPQADYTKALLAAVPYVGHGTVRAAERAAARPTNWTDQPPVVEATGLEIVYPGRFGRAGFRAVDGVDLVIRPRCSASSASPARARPPSAARSPGSPRLAEGARRRDERHPRAPVPPPAEPDRIRLPDPASSFNPLLTIAECVAEPLVIHGRAKDASSARAKVDEMLEAVQLPRAYGDRYPHELSGGQRQRASLARALASSPSC